MRTEQKMSWNQVNLFQIYQIEIHLTLNTASTWINSTWLRLRDLVMIEFEKAADERAMTNGQFFKIEDAGSGQPLDFDVRFVKSDKAKLAFSCHHPN